MYSSASRTRAAARRARAFAAPQGVVLWRVPVCCGHSTHEYPQQTTRRARTAAQAPARARLAAACLPQCSSQRRAARTVGVVATAPAPVRRFDSRSVGLHFECSVLHCMLDGSMKRLVDTGDLAEDQCRELASLLRQERISVRETHTHFMDYGALWVRDEDFLRAREILRTESALYAARARAKWERQWRTEYKNSTLRWFAYRSFRSPAGTIVRVFLLTLMVSAFVVYPLWHVVRKAI